MNAANFSCDNLGGIGVNNRYCGARTAINTLRKND